jgi:hypothetical protein
MNVPILNWWDDRDREHCSNYDDKEEVDLEVAGSERTKAPLVSFADDETDKDLTDQLYSKSKHKPLMDEFSERWDDQLNYLN